MLIINLFIDTSLYSKWIEDIWSFDVKYLCIYILWIQSTTRTYTFQCIVKIKWNMRECILHEWRMLIQIYSCVSTICIYIKKRHESWPCLSLDIFYSNWIWCLVINVQVQERERIEFLRHFMFFLLVLEVMQLDWYRIHFSYWERKLSNSLTFSLASSNVIFKLTNSSTLTFTAPSDFLSSTSSDSFFVLLITYIRCKMRGFVRGPVT